jgi:hypothetical protein
MGTNRYILREQEHAEHERAYMAPQPANTLVISRCNTIHARTGRSAGASARIHRRALAALCA